MEQEFRIRAHEIDAMGVESNMEYLKWFEDIRHVFLDLYYRETSGSAAVDSISS